MLRYASVLLAFVLMQPLSHAQDEPSPELQNTVSEGELLHRTFRQYYGFEAYEFPEEAMARGDYSQANRVTDHSLVAYGVRLHTRERFLNLLHRLDRDKLSPDDQLNYDLFELKVTREIESEHFGSFLAPVGPMGGPQSSIPQMAERVRFESELDYENYLIRLGLVCDNLLQYKQLMERGLVEGITPPRIVLEGVPAQMDKLINGGLAPLGEPFEHMPAHIPADKQAALKKQFQDEALPRLTAAFSDFRTFFVDEYLPKCREDIAATSLPNGKEFYAFRLKEMTTTDLTAEQIHQIGLDEVARIRAEMMTVIRKSDFMQLHEGATSLDDKELFKAFLNYLRTDPRFYCKTADELLDRYRVICKEVDPWLAKLFGNLPRLPYGVKEVPLFMAPTQTTAWYQPGDIRNAEPGYFYANTYALDQRPTYEMIPLALHEAVPGHHLQIAIAQELEGLPEFRKETWFTAFGEGWALYSEHLGIEMGMYEDPYDDFGRLLYEMWRACRLVVDPGMHALGWSREKAIQFMLDNTALSELNITNEIDRYISWPGQACAYKLGELTIRKLRSEAEQQLGAQFNLREFHDVVLGAGGLPLNILERRVHEWMAGKVEN